jgi:hypothetical protein
MMTLSASGRWRAARRAARALATFAACALLLAVADPEAAKRDPFHAHIVSGGSVIENARALVEHTHTPAARPAADEHPCPHPTAERAGPTGLPRSAAAQRVATQSTSEAPVVISVRAPLASVSVGAQSTSAFEESRWNVAPPLPSIAPAAGYPSPRWQAPVLIAPTPPPEAS